MQKEKCGEKGETFAPIQHTDTASMASKVYDAILRARLFCPGFQQLFDHDEGAS